MNIIKAPQKLSVFLDKRNKNRMQFQVGKINDCCKQVENLYLAHLDEKQKARVWRCKTCGRNHYHVQCEPGRIGIIGKDLGK
jgi:rubrerythrin